ncbi:hypothetical protein D9613_008724 [Agrocybe pediades]|uniref:Uncharacterized protein n=1 Tax=Agrocybe pediades TaxID=84607 RepID=A0A8H4VNY9_9AGAR|nr:hypothetical protein D9613_008724 [Agrocybe pediades]
MLLYAILCLAVYGSSNTIPITALAPHNNDIFTTGSNDSDSVCPRTRPEIIWSCLATILAASWVSVHPNMPVVWGPANGKEFVAVYRKKNDRFHWTKTHGFFLQMGGFVLYEDGKAHTLLDWNTLMEYYKRGQVDLSSITETMINDHSKADGFGKGIALLQTTWFIIQCSARFFDDHLVLTELELVTTALALLSFLTYILWWNKPFNAETPIPIILSRPDSNPEESLLQTNNEGPSSPPTVPMSGKSALVDRVSGLYHVTTRLLSFKTPLWALFYASKPSSELTIIQMRLASFSIAALFGGIHCVGWSSKIVFHTHAASLLWRILTVVITASPLVWIMLFVVGYANLEYPGGNFLKRMYLFLGFVSMVLTTLSIPVYVFSRITLLIVAFVELRGVPQGALDNLQWANVLPFIH